MKENLFSYFNNNSYKNFSAIQNNQSIYFNDIEKLSSAFNKEFKDNKIQLVGLITSNTLASIASYFALKKIGIVPIIIPIDDLNISLEYLQKISCEYLVCPDALDFHKQSKVSNRYQNLLFKVNSFEKIKIYKSLKKLEFSNLIPLDGDVLLTSGTSGEKKGVFVSNKSIFSTLEYISSIMVLKKEYSEFLGVPFFHSFGLARVRLALLHGSKLYLPNNHSDVLEAASIIKTIKVSVASFVPASINLFMSFLSKKIGNSFNSLEKIELGSARIEQLSLEWLSNIAPNSTIFHHFGMTEASRSAFRIFSANKKFQLGDENHYVFRPDLKISLRSDHDKAEVDSGTLSIVGPNVFSGYIRNKKDFCNLKTNYCLESDDVIRLSSNGFSIIGKSDLISKRGGKKISLLEIEAKIEELDEIKFAVCYISGSNIRGDEIACNIQLVNSDSFKKFNKTKLNQCLPNHMMPDKLKVVEKVELTFNGKKKRGNFV